ncbi:MAG: hypothetical protein WA632_13285 [Gallionella sp.]
MKKFVLMLASIIGVVAFSTTASALPVFARQTGMACSACHFQHFPLLNSFGRAFKASAFTMIGAQGKVDGDALSIPNTLNMAVLTTAGYEKSNSDTSSVPNTHNAGDGKFYVPGNTGELSLFIGGRITDNAGFLTEIGAAGPAGLASAKMPILFEVLDGTRAGIVPFTTDGLGSSYGFETLNTGANSVHVMSGVGGINDAHSNALSAQHYIGTGAAATGFALVASQPIGFINITKFNQTSADGSDTAAGLGSTYFRIASTFDLAGWDTGIGMQSWSGRSFNPNFDVGGTAVPGIYFTKALAFDAQMQGELAGMPVGLYASAARTPPTSTNGGAAGSAFNYDGTFTRESINFSGEIGVIPEKATLGAAIRRAKSGHADSDGNNATDNAIMLVATYKLAQNMVASLSYTHDSGTFWDAANTAAIGSNTTTVNLFTLF